MSIFSGNDYSTCAWYRGAGTCSFGCREEPWCQTGEPDGGWPQQVARKKAAFDVVYAAVEGMGGPFINVSFVKELTQTIVDALERADLIADTYVVNDDFDEEESDSVDDERSDVFANQFTRAYHRFGLPATMPQEMRDAWVLHKEGKSVPIRLLPKNGDECRADVPGGPYCGYPLLIDGSCINTSDHLDWP